MSGLNNLVRDTHDTLFRADLADSDRADLSGRAYMRATASAWLVSVVSDDADGFAGGCVVALFFGFFVGYIVDVDVDVRIYELLEDVIEGGDVCLRCRELAGVLDIRTIREVIPLRRGESGDTRSCDRDVEEVSSRVETRMEEAAGYIDLACDGHSRCEISRYERPKMMDNPLQIQTDVRHFKNTLTRNNPPTIRRLSAALWIKNRRIHEERATALTVSPPETYCL